MTSNNQSHAKVDHSPSSTKRAKYLLEKTQYRLANGSDNEIYNRALRDAAAWWLTATDVERYEKRKHVFKRELLLSNLFLNPPQIEWYNDYIYKKLEKYEGWTELFKILDAKEFHLSYSHLDCTKDDRVAHQD